MVMMNSKSSGVSMPSRVGDHDLSPLIMPLKIISLLFLQSLVINLRKALILSSLGVGTSQYPPKNHLQFLHYSRTFRYRSYIRHMKFEQKHFTRRSLIYAINAILCHFFNFDQILPFTCLKNLNYMWHKHLNLSMCLTSSHNGPFCPAAPSSFYELEIFYE